MATSVTGKATEFIQFTRASNATVTDSDGKVKWAPHNLLTNSESFDNAAWTKVHITSTTPVVTANAGAAPNGTTTADKVDFGAIDAAGDVSIVSQLYTAEAISYSAGIWIQGVAAGDVGKTVFVYFSDTGVIKGQVAVIVSSSWQYITTSATLTAGANRQLSIGTLGSTYGGANQAAVAVYLWGAHVYRSDLGGMQANTSAYPMYNPTTPKNLLGQSEDFSVSPWSNVGTGGTGVNPVVTANAGLAPNGLQTADRIQFSLAGGTSTSDISRRIQQFSTVSGTPYTFSMWVKSYDGNPYTMHLVGAGGLTSNIVAVTNEWQRVSVTANGFGGTVSFAIGLRGGQTPTNSNTADVLVWGAQLSDSASLDTYSPVYGAAVTSAAYYGPRRDFDPVTLACKGLLVEEQRTNLLTYSAQFDDAIWVKTRSNLTADAAASPSGGTTADLLYDDLTAGNSHVLARIVGNPLASGTYTYSVFAKQAGRQYLQLLGYVDPAITNLRYAVMFDLQSGTVTSTNTTATPPTAIANSIQSVGNGWYRCSITFGNPSGLRVDVRHDLSISNTANVNGVTYNGDGASGVYLWGAQFEAGSFATSYIPTGAATATRSADVASVSTQAFPYSSTEGTIVVNGNWNGADSTLAMFAAFQVDANNVMSLEANNTARSAQLTNRVSGVTDVGIALLNTGTSGVPFKAAAAYKLNDFAAVVNGGTVGTDTSGALVSNVATLSLGARNSDRYLNGHIRQITYLPRRISNTELQTRTT